MGFSTPTARATSSRNSSRTTAAPEIDVDVKRLRSKRCRRRLPRTRGLLHGLLLARRPQRAETRSVHRELCLPFKSQVPNELIPINPLGMDHHLLPRRPGVQMSIRVHAHTEEVAGGRTATSAQPRRATASFTARLSSSYGPHPNPPFSAFGTTGGLVKTQDIPKPILTDNIAHPTPQPVFGSGNSNFDNFANLRRPGQLSSAQLNDHEDAGILNSGGGHYTGVFAIHAVYSPGQLTLTLPAGATGLQTLFAPNTRAPNSACLEIGTAYTTGSGNNNTQVEVYVSISANQVDLTGGATYKWTTTLWTLMDELRLMGIPATHSLFRRADKITSSSVWRASFTTSRLSNGRRYTKAKGRSF